MTELFLRLIANRFIALCDKTLNSRNKCMLLNERVPNMTTYASAVKNRLNFHHLSESNCEQSILMDFFYYHIYFFMALDNRWYWVNNFLILHENICCGYSLEVPQRGTSNEYHNIFFHREIRKISILFGWKKVSYLGICSSHACPVLLCTEPLSFCHLIIIL